MSKPETLRRLILGELQRVLRARYGPELPDDDAGREDLELLLLYVADGREREAIEIWAPWMPERVAADTVLALPCWRPDGVELGKQLRLTNAEREACRAWHVVAVDAAELEEQRKAKRRARQAERRRKVGAISRAQFLATSKTKLKPWEREHMSRAKWYRLRRETGVKPIKSLSRPQTCLTTQGRGAGRRRTSPPHHKNGNGRVTRGPP